MPPVGEQDRPDPMTGRQASAAYAEVYAAHHRTAADSLDYRLLNGDLVLLDGLLSEYRLLDVGCATGGYLRLLRNHAHVTGLDFSADAIATARQLQAEFGTPRVEFTVGRFEDFQAEAPFDAVRLRGTFGSYQPWPISVGAIEKTRALLKAGGIAIASHHPPTNLMHAVKAAVMPARTLAISARRFNALWSARGFTLLLVLQLEHANVAFWRKD